MSDQPSSPCSFEVYRLGQLEDVIRTALPSSEELAQRAEKKGLPQSRTSYYRDVEKDIEEAVEKAKKAIWKAKKAEKLLELDFYLLKGTSGSQLAPLIVCQSQIDASSDSNGSGRGLAPLFRLSSDLGGLQATSVGALLRLVDRLSKVTTGNGDEKVKEACHILAELMESSCYTVYYWNRPLNHTSLLDHDGLKAVCFMKGMSWRHNLPRKILFDDTSAPVTEIPLIAGNVAERGTFSGRENIKIRWGVQLRWGLCRAAILLNWREGDSPALSSDDLKVLVHYLNGWLMAQLTDIPADGVQVNSPVAVAYFVFEAANAEDENVEGRIRDALNNAFMSPGKFECTLHLCDEQGGIKTEDEKPSKCARCRAPLIEGDTFCVPIHMDKGLFGVIKCTFEREAEPQEMKLTELIAQLFTQLRALRRSRAAQTLIQRLIAHRFKHSFQLLDGFCKAAREMIGADLVTTMVYDPDRDIYVAAGSDASTSSDTEERDLGAFLFYPELDLNDQAIFKLKTALQSQASTLWPVIQDAIAHQSLARKDKLTWEIFSEVKPLAIWDIKRLHGADQRVSSYGRMFHSICGLPLIGDDAAQPDGVIWLHWLDEPQIIAAQKVSTFPEKEEALKQYVTSKLGEASRAVAAMYAIYRCHEAAPEQQGTWC